MSEHRCGGCRYFVPWLQNSSPDSGECHRYPPQSEASDLRADDGIEFVKWWPAVDRDLDWCGEWKAP